MSKLQKIINRIALNKTSITLLRCTRVPQFMEIYTNNKNYLIDGFVDDYNTTDIFAPLAVEMIAELETHVRLLTRELSDFS